MPLTPNTPRNGKISCGRLLNSMSLTFAQCANRVFRQIIILIAAIFGLLIFLFYQVYSKIDLYFNAVAHKITAACGCTQISQFLTMHPIIFGMIIVSGIGILVFITYSLYRLIRLWLQTRKFSGHYLLLAKRQYSAKLKSIINNLGLSDKNIVEIKNSELLAFCFGFLRPRICISDALIKLLSHNELRAVLLHEQQHIIAREPLKLFFVKYCQCIFFFVPGIKIIIRKYITFSELAADERACDGANSRSILANVILKISGQGDYLSTSQNLALPFFSPIVVERANHLVNTNYVPKFRVLSRKFIMGAISLAIIISSIFVFLIDSTEAFEMHNINSCVLSNGAKGDTTCNVMDKQNTCNKNNATCRQSTACHEY